MLKTAFTVLTISAVFSVLVSLVMIVSPQIIGGSTLESRSGQALADIADTIVAQTRHMAIFALTS